MQAERDLEIEVSLCRQAGKDLYDIAKMANKEIILVSDMYLDRETILAILQKNGYNSEDFTLYLSSEIKKTKATGNLYRFILREEQIKSSAMVHIGDNYHSDFQQAQSKNIHACYFPNVFSKLHDDLLSKTFMHTEKEIDSQMAFWHDINIRKMLAPVANKLFDFPFQEKIEHTNFNANPTYIGYYALGMHLYSVVKWLLYNNNENTIHFVARDGYLPKLAFDIINNKKIKTNYLYLSRKVLSMIDVYKPSDLLSLIAKLDIKNHSVKKIANYFDTDHVRFSVLREKCKKAKIGFEKLFESEDDFFKAIVLFDEEVIDYEKHNASKSILKNYFAKQIKKGDVLFDLGYSGRAESCLTLLLGFSVNSFYLHVNNEIEAERASRCNFRIRTFCAYVPKICGHIREILFMAQHGSLLKYEFKQAGAVSFIFSNEKKQVATEKMIQIVQQQALNYVRDITNSLGKNEDIVLENKRITSSVPYESFLHVLSQADLALFENYIFEDNVGMGNIKLGEALYAKKMGNFTRVPEHANAIKLMIKVNAWLPIGSRRRELVKKTAKFVYKFAKKTYRIVKPKK